MFNLLPKIFPFTNTNSVSSNSSKNNPYLNSSNLDNKNDDGRKGSSLAINIPMKPLHKITKREDSFDSLSSSSPPSLTNSYSSSVSSSPSTPTASTILPLRNNIKIINSDKNMSLSTASNLSNPENTVSKRKPLSAEIRRNLSFNNMFENMLVNNPEEYDRSERVRKNVEKKELDKQFDYIKAYGKLPPKDVDIMSLEIPRPFVDRQPDLNTVPDLHTVKDEKTLAVKKDSSLEIQPPATKELRKQ